MRENSSTQCKQQVGGDHYLAMKIQPWDIIDTWSLEEQVAYYKGNVLKYLLRAGIKSSLTEVEDLKKARHYLDKLIESLDTDLAK